MNTREVNQRGQPAVDEAVFINDLTERELYEVVGMLIERGGFYLRRTNVTKHGNMELKLMTEKELFG